MLIVDDDGDILTIGRICLERVSGFAVETVSSGREAVRVAKSCRPDVILLDMMMPEMDGLTTASALAADAETRDVPIVFLTAKAMSTDVGAYRAHGAIGVLTKPFDPMTLGDALSSLLRKAESQRAEGDE